MLKRLSTGQEKKNAGNFGHLKQQIALLFTRFMWTNSADRQIAIKIVIHESRVKHYRAEWDWN